MTCGNAVAPGNAPPNLTPGPVSDTPWSASDHHSYPATPSRGTPAALFTSSRTFRRASAAPPGRAPAPRRQRPPAERQRRRRPARRARERRPRRDGDDAPAGRRPGEHQEREEQEAPHCGSELLLCNCKVFVEMEMAKAACLYKPNRTISGALQVATTPQRRGARKWLISFSLFFLYFLFAKKSICFSIKNLQHVFSIP